MAFDEVDGAHKPFCPDIDDDGSTSAGSSDIESEGTGSSQFYVAPTLPQCVSAPPGLASPPGFAPPLGFSAPPGLVAPDVTDFPFPPPPGLGPPGLMPPPGLVDDFILPEPEPFNPKKFRRELVSVLKDLAQNKNVAAAVRRVRACQVPVDRQAAETMDILTRAAEENRGNPRRLYFAFVAGLARGNPSAFEQKEVLSGIKAFFKDIYEDLCEEVPRLPSMIEAELCPVLREVFAVETVESLLPSGFKVA
jgi:hypothetical protein